MRHLSVIMQNVSNYYCSSSLVRDATHLMGISNNQLTLGLTCILTGKTGPTSN